MAFTRPSGKVTHFLCNSEMAFCLLPRKAGPAQKAGVFQKGEGWRGMGDAETGMGGDQEQEGWGFQAFYMQMTTFSSVLLLVQLSSTSHSPPPHFLPRFRPFFLLYSSQLLGLFLLLLLLLPLPPSFSLSGNAQKYRVGFCYLWNGLLTPISTFWTDTLFLSGCRL